MDSWKGLWEAKTATHREKLELLAELNFESVVVECIALPVPLADREEA